MRGGGGVVMQNELFAWICSSHIAGNLAMEDSKHRYNADKFLNASGYLIALSLSRVFGFTKIMANINGLAVRLWSSIFHGCRIESFRV